MLWDRFRAWPVGVQVALVLVAAVVLLRPFTGGERETVSALTPEPSPPAVAAVADQAPTPTPTPPATPTPTPTPPATPTPTPPPMAALPVGVPRGAQAGVVERVVDGDTIAVRVDEEGGPLLANAAHTIRLLVIDTPETRHPQRGVECWGPEAEAYTAERLAVGSTVYLLGDLEDTDRYGRFLRYVWTADGAFFNEQAARDGFARAVVYEPNDALFPQVRSAEQDARAAGRGMWGPPCDYDAPAPAPVRGPVPAPQPEAGRQGVSSKNCSQARAAGAAPVRRGDPGYGPHLDRDNDGVGCE